MLSYPHTDKLFEGAAPPSAWFYTFEENRNVAVQDLLLGAADLGPFGTLDPWAVALQWLQGFSDTEFPKKFDAALAEWIANSWGEPVHPASYGSAVLTARAWESASLIIANFDRLPVSANILRDRVLGNREFLSFMGEGPSRDPAGRAWQVLAQYQEDDSLFEEWNLILKLGPGVPWHHGQYGLMGLDLLPGHRRGAGIPSSLAFGLRSFGHALLKRLSDGYLNEDNARREFERLSRWAQRRYPFKSAWRSVWRQMITSEYDRLAPWVSESLGSDDPLLGRAEKELVKLPTARQDWLSRVQLLRNQLKRRPTAAILSAAHTLLSEEEEYYRATGDSYSFVRTACNFASVLPERWLASGIPWLEMAARFDSSNPYPVTQLATALTRSGNLLRAEQVARRGVYQFPLDVFAFEALGEVLRTAGKLDEAESVYRETVRRFPDNVPARNGLAGVLKALGKLEEAKSVYRDILDRFPKDVYAKKGLDSIDRLKPGSEEIDAPDFEWGFIPEFDGDLIPELDLEFVPELDDELTVQSGPPTDEPPQPQLEDSSQIRSLDVDRGSPEEPAPPALDLPASRPSGEGPAFLRPSDIDILIQDSHLLRKWARGTGELAMSHLREEARSLLGKLERFLRSSPSAVLESSLLLIETQNIQSALQLLDEAGARYPDSKRVQYASARTRREAARQARQEGHPFTFDSPSATDIPIAWTKLLRLEPVLLPTVRLGLVRSLPYLTDGLRLRKAQHSALGQLGFALHSLQPAKETKDPRSYWAYRVGELLLGDRAAEVRGASEVLDHDIDVASQNNEKHLLTLNGLEEDLLLHYHLL